MRKGKTSKDDGVCSTGLDVSCQGYFSFFLYKRIERETHKDRRVYRGYEERRDDGNDRIE